MSNKTTEALAVLDEAAENAFIATTDTGAFSKMRGIAQHVQAMRAALTPEVLADIRAMQNTPLGFLTDRKDGYNDDTLRECAIEAAARGVQIAGNHFNILAGRCYITKDGFSYLMKKLVQKGIVRDLRIIPGLPEISGASAKVRMRGEWKGKDGKDQNLELELPIKVNAHMGDDAILGKAERKLRKRIYEQITGNEVADGDVGDMAPPAPLMKQAQVHATEASPSAQAQTARELTPREIVSEIRSRIPEDLSAGDVINYLVAKGITQPFDELEELEVLLDEQRLRALHGKWDATVTAIRTWKAKQK